MELDEFMISILEWYTELEDTLSEEEIDRIDETIKAVACQMNWVDRITYVST